MVCHDVQVETWWTNEAASLEAQITGALHALWENRNDSVDILSMLTAKARDKRNTFFENASDLCITAKVCSVVS